MDETGNTRDRELEECRRAYQKRTEQFRSLLKQSKEMTAKLRMNFDGIVHLLSDITSQTSPTMGDHTKRTAALARSIAHAMRLNPDRRRLVFYAATLHDLSLTGKEREWLDENSQDWTEHPNRSADLIATVRNLERVASTVRSHQEYYNGEGFPRGLKGEKIPLESRIITAALSYDRKTALERVASDTTLESMEASGRFDPQVLSQLKLIVRSEKDLHSTGDRLIRLKELTPGMKLADDLILSNGFVLYPRGTILDEETRTRILNFDRMFPKDNLIRIYGTGHQ